MKTNKIILFFGILLCLIGFTSIVYADNLANRLSGRILLQVEENGEAWYVNPVNNERYFLGRPADAFKIMRNFGLGISNSDLDQIPIAQVSNGFSGEITKIIQQINAYCEKYNIEKCLPITSSAVIDINERFSVVNINDNTNYLLTKKDNEWNVSIASKEYDICDTGSGSSDLFEYCND